MDLSNKSEKIKIDIYLNNCIVIVKTVLKKHFSSHVQQNNKKEAQSSYPVQTWNIIRRGLGRNQIFDIPQSWKTVENPVT